VRPRVIAFHIHVGRCRRCGRRAQGRDARQTSTAVGAAASQVGPRALAWAAWLHTGLGVPFAKVATIFRTGFGLAISPGGLVQALHRVAARSTPTYHGRVYPPNSRRRVLLDYCRHIRRSVCNWTVPRFRVLAYAARA
jgi:hypothetical protein